MKYYKHTLFLLSGLGLAVNAAVAQDSQSRDSGIGGIHVVISEYDTDSNMTLSQDEFSTLRDERLQGLEMPEELPEAEGQADSQSAAGQENLFGRLDLNGNGELDAEELTASTEVMSELHVVEQTAAASAGTSASSGTEGPSREGGEPQPLSQGGSSDSDDPDVVAVPVPVPAPVPVPVTVDETPGGDLEPLVLNDINGFNGESIYASAEDGLLGIGEIQRVVRSTRDGQLHAIVSSEELLEIDEEGAIPLSDFRMIDDRIVYQGDEAELQRELEEQNFQASMYEPLERNDQATLGR